MDWYYYHIANVNDDILTVVLIMSSYGDRIMFSYNIDINNGKEIKKDEVLNVSLREIYDEIFCRYMGSAIFKR